MRQYHNSIVRPTTEIKTFGRVILLQTENFVRQFRVQKQINVRTAARTWNLFDFRRVPVTIFFYRIEDSG